MAFNPGVTGISGANDVALSAPANNHVLTYDTTTAKWKNAASQGGLPTYANVLSGSTFTVYKASGGSWPGSRPSSRTDIFFIFKGSGTAGQASSPESIMLDGDDWQILP